MTAQQLSGGFEVLSIASIVDGSVVRVLASTYNRNIVSLNCTDEQVSADFATQLSSTIPRTIDFTENNRDIRVFGLHDGIMYVFWGVVLVLWLTTPQACPLLRG
jgi:hypothetical protein